MLVFLLGFFVVFRLGSGYGELAAHEELIVQDFYGALGFFYIDHFDEAVAFGAVGAAVIDDFDAADGTDAFEEFFKIALGGFIGEVADVDAAALDGGWIATTGAVFVSVTALTALTAVVAPATARFFTGGFGGGFVA